MTSLGGALAVTWLFVCGQASAAMGNQQNSVRRFVQSFYDWYVPIALRRGTVGPAWDQVLERRPSVLAPELARTLRLDSEAEASAPGEIVGLEFDPFLGSQDPCERYEVARVRRSAGGYSVTIHAVCTKNETYVPEVVAEVARGSRGWRFTNFVYPQQHSDLMSLLSRLRQQRERRP